MAKTKTRNQSWFNKKYSNKEEIDISEAEKLKLKGSLKIQDFANLKRVSLKEFKLTNLDISRCSQLTEIKLSELSTLTSLSVTECSNLTKLDCSTSIRLTKLEIFNCSELNDIAYPNSPKFKNLHVRGYSDLSALSKTDSTSLESLKISECSQLNKVDLSKFPKVTSLSVIDCSKLAIFDCSSIELNSLEIFGCSKLDQITGFSKLPNLKSLSIIDCPKLTRLDCSNSKLTTLGVSHLTELDCSNTLIEELSLNLCPNIIKLNCSNNSKIINLEVSNCKKLEFLDCSHSKLTSLDVSYCPRSINITSSTGLVITREKEPIMNILIVGRTGSGKSTLANVLTGTEEFKESAYAVSETKYFRKEKFEWNEKIFRVVDTIGTGDTKLELKDVLYKIADGIYAMPEGISQVLFVVDGRFTKEEINTFNMIKNSILEIKILDYVTLVRTKFNNFRSKNECEIDKKKMRDENETIAEIINSCNEVIHVDNPSTNIEDCDDDDHENQISVNKNAREKSRKKMLEYLENVPPVKDHKYFKLKTWEELHDSIHDYVKNNKDAQKMLKKNPELEAIYNASELCLIL